MGTAIDDTSRPKLIDTIIGFFNNPSPTVRKTPNDMRPSRDPVIKITTKLLNTIRSTASTIMTGPIAACPSSKTSMGMPKNPTLPITAHWASIAASATDNPRDIATTVASKYTTKVPAKYAQTNGQSKIADISRLAANRNNIADSAK